MSCLQRVASQTAAATLFQKSPALQTALKCSDAFEALRQLSALGINCRQAFEKENASASAGAAAEALTTEGAGGALASALRHPGGSRTAAGRSSHAAGVASLSLEEALGEGGASLLDFSQALQDAPLFVQFYAVPRVFVGSPSSHVLVFPNPRWVELRKASPVYIKSLCISPLSLTVSIRTSEHRISRQVLHIVDALPLDTPYMGIQIARERRKFTVCSWQELLHSLRNAYLRQFIRQSLPSAWASNACAFLVGFARGISALFRLTFRGATTSGFEGVVTGFRTGFILFVLYTMGGVMQSVSHVLNILHKLMRGSRPRPYGVLDAFWKGFNGLVLDALWRPWVALIVEPAASSNR